MCVLSIGKMNLFSRDMQRKNCGSMFDCKKKKSSVEMLRSEVYNLQVEVEVMRRQVSKTNVALGRVQSELATVKRDLKAKSLHTVLVGKLLLLRKEGFYCVCKKNGKRNTYR